MIRHSRATASIILGALVWIALAGAGHTDPPAKAAKDLLPQRKQIPLKGTVVGVLLTDGQQILSTEGRSGPADQLCFSMAGCSYRWVYVTVADKPPITNLKVPVGEDGKGSQIYPALDLARPTNVKGFGVEAGYSLVEIQVNNGQGSPAVDSFVATNIRVLDGTKEFPLKVAEVVKGMQAKFAQHLKDQAKAIDEAVDKAGQAVLAKDEKATGPQEKHEVMYVTWMPDTERLRVTFRVKVSDGKYTFEERGGIGPKGKGKIQPPPPPKVKVKVGTSFGVEFGVTYEIDKAGQLVSTEVAPFASFTERLQVPVGRDGGPPIDLPPPPLPPAKD
jgi:hypothetical protein